MYREMVPVMMMKLLTLLHCPRRHGCRNTHSTVRNKKILNVSTPTPCRLARELCMYVMQAESKLQASQKQIRSKLKASEKQDNSTLEAS